MSRPTILLLTGLLLATSCAPAFAVPTAPSASAEAIVRSTPPRDGFWAVLEACHDEAGTPSCAAFALPEPFPNLSDCLIAVERADQGLRRIRASLAAGICTTTRPEGL